VLPTDACNTDAYGANGTVCSTSIMTTFGTFVALKVSQPVTSMQPSAFCEWGCGAQTCRIQLSDGLPVELMSFEIDGQEDEADNTEQ